MNLIKKVLESGFRKSDDYQQRRITLLTNSISLILVGMMLVLFVVRVMHYSFFSTPMELFVAAALCTTPVFLNHFRWHAFSRLLLSIGPILFIWYAFIAGMRSQPEVPITIFDGLRLYLLATSCIPFLVFGKDNRRLFIIGVIPSILSVVGFELIMNALGVKREVPADQDYVLMQVRFVMSYSLIAISCYVLQRTIFKNDQINNRLLKRLQEKNAIIESQNRELLVSRTELSDLNRQLEELLEQRARKIYSQKKSILSYAYANSHYVRGPVARLMGAIELFKIDKEVGCDWLVETVDREARQMDNTIRRLSREMGPLD